MERKFDDIDPDEEYSRLLVALREANRSGNLQQIATANRNLADFNRANPGHNSANY